MDFDQISHDVRLPVEVKSVSGETININWLSLFSTHAMLSFDNF